MNNEEKMFTNRFKEHLDKMETGRQWIISHEDLWEREDIEGREFYHFKDGVNLDEVPEEAKYAFEAWNAWAKKSLEKKHLREAMRGPDFSVPDEFKVDPSELDYDEF